MYNWLSFVQSQLANGSPAILADHKRSICQFVKHRAGLLLLLLILKNEFFRRIRRYFNLSRVLDSNKFALRGLLLGEIISGYG